MRQPQAASGAGEPDAPSALRHEGNAGASRLLRRGTSPGHPVHPSLKCPCAAPQMCGSARSLAFKGFEYFRQKNLVSKTNLICCVMLQDTAIHLARGNCLSPVLKPSPGAGSRRRYKATLEYLPGREGHSPSHVLSSTAEMGHSAEGVPHIQAKQLLELECQGASRSCFCPVPGL